MKTPHMLNKHLFLLLAFSIMILAGGRLASNVVSADDVIDDVAISVPVSCTLTGTGQNSHNAEITNGTYQENIGTTTLKVICNDNEGFAIYAIGFTNDQYSGEDHTKLIGATTNQKISTGTATSGSTSNWAMKLATDSTQTYPITIDNSFDNYHIVPDTYTKVAHRDSGTDLGNNATGTTLTTTYASFISAGQVADTYSGKVKYTLVHPASAEPFIPHAITCEPEKICYNTNADPTETEGTMGNQSLANKNIDWSSCAYTDYSATCIDSNYQSININTLPILDYYTTELTASNYSRSNYGFAGWNTAYDYSGTNYGPQETVVIEDNIAEDGLSLYAIWVPVAKDSDNNELTFQTPNLKTVTLKDGDALNNKPNGYVTALRDIRDDDVYAIAKLADGQYWMIENLRLDNDANITTSNTQSNNGAWGGVFIGLADPEPLSNFTTYPIISNSLYNDTNITGNLQGYRYPRYNNDNTARVNGASPYIYGNFYSWAASAADTSIHDSSGEANIPSTSICSSGWRLPTGNYNDSDFTILNDALGDDTFGQTASRNWRKYPNNYLFASHYASSTIYNDTYSGALYSSAYLEISSRNNVTLDREQRIYKRTIRCIADN